MDNETNKNIKTYNIDNIDILKHLQINDTVSQPQSEQREGSDKWKATIIGGGILALLLKFKGVLLLLLGKLKFLYIFLKLGKILSTFGSMSLMIWVEAMRYGWVFGIGFVLLIFVHEMGHYWMAKHEKLDVGAPIFIPFVGAFISLKEQPKSALVEAKVAFAGPIAGSAAALLLMLVYTLTGSPVWHSLAYAGILLNIFNLIPLSPLDGGRIATALSPKLWIVGLVLALVFFFVTLSPILILIVILGCIRIYEFWKNRQNHYYELPLIQRMQFTAGYFGLVVLLGAAAFTMYNAL